MNKTVYIVSDNSVWNDEEYNEIVAVTMNKEKAVEIMKNYIELTKKEIDFDKLEISKDGTEDGCYVTYQDEDGFGVSLNGEYNSYHININIIEKELILDKEIEEDYGF